MKLQDALALKERFEKYDNKSPILKRSGRITEVKLTFPHNLSYANLFAKDWEINIGEGITIK